MSSPSAGGGSSNLFYYYNSTSEYSTAIPAAMTLSTAQYNTAPNSALTPTTSDSFIFTTPTSTTVGSTGATIEWYQYTPVGGPSPGRCAGFYLYNGTTGEGFGCVTYYDSYGFVYASKNASGQSNITIGGTGATAGQWNHYAVTYTPGRTMYGWINGVPSLSYNFSSTYSIVNPLDTIGLLHPSQFNVNEWSVYVDTVKVSAGMPYGSAGASFTAPATLDRDANTVFYTRFEQRP